MQIEANSSVPIFRQIVDGLCARRRGGGVRAGGTRPVRAAAGDESPGQPEHRATRRYEDLSAGILVSRRGSGMEVTANAPSIARERMSDGVRGSFFHGIETGKSAKLSKETIDGLYRKAWNGHRGIR